MNLKQPATIIKGIVTKGIFVPETPGVLDHLDGMDASAVVNKYRMYCGRSSDQNDYYWCVVVRILGAEWGYDWRMRSEKYKVHEIIKQECLVASTINLNTLEFEEMMSMIRLWALTEFNCFIPLPREVPFDFLTPEPCQSLF